MIALEGVCEVFYVERFVELDAEICGSGVSQNGKLLSAGEFVGIGRGYFRMWTEPTKVGLTGTRVALWGVQCHAGLETMGVMFLV